MPSRKKNRGKQRKERQKLDALGLTGSESDLLKTLLQGLHDLDNPPQVAAKLMGKMKSKGCRFEKDKDGGIAINHPCLHAGAKSGDLSKRDHLDDACKLSIAQNYVHNYAQEMREGDFHGTEVILDNISDLHIRPQLVDELLKADIHLSFLHFLNQSDKSVSNVLGRVMDTRKSIKLTSYWIGILQRLVDFDGRTEDSLLTLAKGMTPFVMAMMDEKRELFQSNLTWHINLDSFFNLVRGIMMSKESLLVMISYEGFLPFVAQASCWSQSRKDIVEESRLVRRSRDKIVLACHRAQSAIASIIQKHADVLGEDVIIRVRDQIACTPLLGSDPPNCDDSMTVGFIRMMSADNGVHRKLLLGSIIEPLLLKRGYVDERVIAELIGYGKGSQSMEAAETVLKLMAEILGRDNNCEHIKMVDSRYAAAVRYGLLEFCIDALVAFGDDSDCKIAGLIVEEIYYIANGLCSIAMHSKTSRALREKEPEILTALDMLQKHSTASLAMHSKTSRVLRERKAEMMKALGARRKLFLSRSNAICRLIDGAIDLSAPAVCCNCLKEVDRKNLLYCKRCGVECYCSLACQSESYGLGHDELCKKEAEFMDDLREQGLSDAELKRTAVLSINLMLNGCSFVQSNAVEFLGVQGECTTVAIDLGHCPPNVEVSRDETLFNSSDTLKFIFVVPVHYGFAEKVDVKGVQLEKVVSRRSLVRQTLRAAQLDSTQQRITNYFDTASGDSGNPQHREPRA